MDNAVEQPLYTYFDFFSQREAIHSLLKRILAKTGSVMAGR